MTDLWDKVLGIESFEAEYDGIVSRAVFLNDLQPVIRAARERPSALDVDQFWIEWVQYNDDATRKGSGFTKDQMTGARAFSMWLLARLTEPNAGEGAEILEPDGTPTRDVWSGAGARLVELPRVDALDVEAHRAAYCRVMHPGQHDGGPYCVNRHGDAIAAEYARLTEPDAGEGTER